MTLSRIAVSILTAAFTLSPALAQERMGFSSETFQAHRLVGIDIVDAPAGMASTFRDLDIEIEVSAAGDVTAARAAGVSKSEITGANSFSVMQTRDLEGVDPAPALAAVKDWKFEPFTFHGKPIAAIGIVHFQYRSPPRWRDPDTPFPAIDYATLRVELFRTHGCFGNCPIYSVSIDGTGKAIFAPYVRLHQPDPPGVAGVDFTPMVRETRLDRAALDALIERFRKAHFFGLEKSYAYGITGDVNVLRFRTGGHVMEVSERAGGLVGMPAVVTELEKALDDVSGATARTSSDAQTATGLIAAGLQPASPTAQEIALRSLGDGDAVVIGLIKQGMPLDVPFARHAHDKPVLFGAYLMGEAIEKGLPKLFAMLESRGWLERMSHEALNLAFADGAGGCDPALAEILVRKGADPNARGLGGRTALYNAVSLYRNCRQSAGSVVVALTRLGADLNVTDDDGETALFWVQTPELQEQLIAAGARVDIRASDGGNALVKARDDRTAIGLLEAGIDPSGKDFMGRTIRQRAGGMPATLAWLDAHHIK